MPHPISDEALLAAKWQDLPGVEHPHRLRSAVRGGKSVGIVDLWDDFGDQYDAMWVRVYGDDSTDRIYCGDPNGQWPYRPCEYGFDEVRVTADGEPDLPRLPGPTWRRSGHRTWSLLTIGTYYCGNSRVDMDRAGPGQRPGKRAWQVPWPVHGPSGQLTPTTPAYYGARLELVEPLQLRNLVEADNGDPRVQAVELFWRGRLVHRIGRYYDDLEGRPTWQHRGVDWWDNCRDPEFVEFHTARYGLA